MLDGRRTAHGTEETGQQVLIEMAVRPEAGANVYTVWPNPANCLGDVVWPESARQEHRAVGFKPVNCPTTVDSQMDDEDHGKRRADYVGGLLA